ncbi:MAG: tetratricopeptide repeat protein, partial [Gemmatimonadota bacterium]
LSLTLLSGGLLLAQSGNDLYQQALVKERAEGDVQGAIELYQRIAREFAADRPLAAKALVQMGLCYEKLGLTEARQAYQQVIDVFPEQRGEVAVARERLVILAQALAELETGPTFRKIEIASKPQNGVLSPDGSKLAFVADESVWMVPLHGAVDPDIAGEPIRLTDDIGAWNNLDLISWSANGEWIAVIASLVDAAVPGTWDDAIGVVHVKDGSVRVVPAPTNRGGRAQTMRVSLSPDGSTLAYTGFDPDTPEPDSRPMPARGWSHFIFTVPVSGGPPQRLTRHWSRMPAFSPDGRHIAYVGPLINQLPVSDESSENDALSNDALSETTGLWVVPSEGGEPVRLASVAGQLSGHVWSPDGTLLAALWGDERNSSRKEVWVFPVAADRTEVGEPLKFDLPKSVHGALPGWTQEGDLGVFILTEYSGAVYTVPASGGRAVQLSSGGGPEGWDNPRWSPDGSRIFVRLSEMTDSDPQTFRNWIGSFPAGGGEMEEIPLQWDRPIIPRFPGAGIHVSPDGETVVFAGYEDRGSGNARVQLWTIPVRGGQPTQLTYGREWVTNPRWSRDGSHIAFLLPVTRVDGEHAIHLIPAEGGEARAITKEIDRVARGDIAFSPDGQRIAFFSGDAIKTISVSGGEPRTLIQIDGFNQHSELAWSPSGEAIAYSYDGRIWVASLDGGRPQELVTGLPGDLRLGYMSWSPDGQKIAFTGVKGGDLESWLISDFLPEGR